MHRTDADLIRQKKFHETMDAELSIDSAAYIIHGLTLINRSWAFALRAKTAFFDIVARYVLMPAYAIHAVGETIFNWYQFYLTRASGSLLKAIVQTVFAAAITVACIGMLVSMATFAVVGPALFTAAIAGKSLFNFFKGIYHIGEGAWAVTENEKIKCYQQASESLIEAFIGGVMAAGFAIAILFANPFVNIIFGGVIAITTFCSIVFLATKQMRLNDDKCAFEKEHPELKTDDQNELSSSAKLSRALGASATDITLDLSEDANIEPPSTDVTINLTAENPLSQTVTWEGLGPNGDFVLGL